MPRLYCKQDFHPYLTVRKPVILITGANGEIGHGLIKAIAERNDFNIVAMDLDPLESDLKLMVQDAVTANILDTNMLERINAKYEISAIYHLAAILSSRAEFSPHIAHDVNVGGTLNLLKIAVEQASSQGKAVKFFFPSSIAVYGLGDADVKKNAGAITENEYCQPKTMYGCNKLYCEHLGRYFSKYYQRLSAVSSGGMIDFRTIRFPGLISADTVPSGGTSDYGPEMIHAVAQGEPYACFVRPDTTMPFMTMPDAISAMEKLMEADAQSLTRTVYHISSFSASAQDFADKISNLYEKGEISFKVSDKRQAIVDSWPSELDDTAARTDWGWEPEFDFDAAFDNYLVPEINKRYGE